MDYNDLALFTRVVERGSFTAAAHAVQLPKSSVTRSIARLERELGVRLIQRTTRQRGVTDAGRELYERVRNAVGVLEEAATVIKDSGREPRGVVRVTAPVDATLMGMSDALARLRERYPSIHVELVLTSRMVDLVAEGIDLAVRAGRLSDSSLIARKVGITHQGLFASKAYLDRRGRPRRVADLASHDCVLFRGRAGRATWVLTPDFAGDNPSRGGSSRDAFVAASSRSNKERVGAAPRPRTTSSAISGRHQRSLGLEGGGRTETLDVVGSVSSDDFAFSLAAIGSGLGIGALPLFAAEAPSNSLAGTIERVLPRYRFEGGVLHIVMPSASLVPARVAIVRDFLVEHLTGLLASDRIR